MALPGRPDVAVLRMVDGTFVEYGTDFLIECEQKSHKLSDGAVSVSTERVHDAVVPALVAESRNAGLVVLQHHRMNRRHQLPLLSVTRAFTPLASEFPEVECRIVAVHGWAPARSPTTPPARCWSSTRALDDAVPAPSRRSPVMWRCR